jgi:hypothetical protein
MALADISITPEALTKLLWRFGSISPSSSVVLEDLDRENDDEYSTESIEKHLVLYKYIFHRQQEYWKIKSNYRRSRIKKSIHNLDKTKQHSALHYVIWYNNIDILEK